jgi:hypothetical protein
MGGPEKGLIWIIDHYSDLRLVILWRIYQVMQIFIFDKLKKLWKNIVNKDNIFLVENRFNEGQIRD